MRGMSLFKLITAVFFFFLQFHLDQCLVNSSSSKKATWADGGSVCPDPQLSSLFEAFSLRTRYASGTCCCC